MKHLRLMLLLVVLFAFVLPISAQEPDLESLLSDYVAPEDHGVVMYVSSEEGQWVAVNGLADLENGTPVQAADRFRIASMTKPFVAVTMLLLQEEGLLSLDDPISDTLPEDVISNIPYADEITIRQLLAMTSGIYNYTDTDAYYEAIEADPTYAWTAAETIPFIYGQEPYFAPGEGYFYSNTNYNLAQIIIETVTGSTLADVLETQIFAPLGMESSFLENPAALGQGIVQGYDGSENITLFNDGVGLGDGGIISTAADLDLFLRGLFEGDLLSEESLAEMMAWADDGEGGEYGLGLERYYIEDYEIYAHSGASAGFQSNMLYVPDEGIVVVILTNDFNSEVVEALSEEALFAVLEEIE